MKKIALTSLLVNDYDETIAFYSQRLGFSVVEDEAFGPDRWVTLGLGGDVRIGLLKATEERDRALVGKQSGSFPLMSIHTDDCKHDYEHMRSLGVRFHGEPSVGPWGVGVSLEDLYGNRIFLNQEG